MTYTLPDFRAHLLIAFSAFIMVYSYLISVLPILLFYAIWFPHAFYKNKFALMPTPLLVLVGLFPFICVFSYVWSDYAGQTLYMSVAFSSMLVCTAIIARLVTVEAFMKGLTLGLSAVMLLTLATDDFSGSLLGLFSSKNIIGFFSSIALVTSFLCGGYTTGRIQTLIYAFIPFVLSLICLILSQSMTSIISTIFTFGLLLGGLILSKFPGSARPVILFIGLGLAGALTLFFFAFEIDLYGMMLDAADKSRTLTGRTWLWEQGIERGLSTPLLGHGYSAFWVPGQPYAELYWAEFSIASKSGFHFHNLYIETFVELGSIGLLALCALITTAYYTAIKRIIQQGLNTDNAFILSILTLFLIRSSVEIDILGPYGFGVMVFYYLVLVQEKRSHA